MDICNLHAEQIEEHIASLLIYPARHHVTPKEQVDEACEKIEAELEERVKALVEIGEPLAADRLAQRTRADLQLLKVAECRCAACILLIPATLLHLTLPHVSWPS